MIHGVHRIAKKKVEDILDVCDQWGWFVGIFFPRKPSYERFVGIKLNTDRAYARRTAAGAYTYGAGMNAGDVVPGPDFFMAQMDDDEAGKLEHKMALQAQHARREARQPKKKG